MNLDLKNKNALICGSSKGIGKATAIEMALLGANVTLVARSEDLLRKALNELSISNGQQHDFFISDFDDPETLRKTVDDYLKKTCKNFSILVNNTGGPAAGPIIEATSKAFEDAFARHLLCNQILLQSLLPGMIKSGYGRVINIISTSVKQPIEGLGVSNTIRGAVANWAKTLSMELGHPDITVNNILPGYTETGRLDALLSEKANKTGLTVNEIRRQMQDKVPLKRFAKPEEVAAAAAFIASPAASYINGINLPVDGGRTSSL